MTNKDQAFQSVKEAKKEYSTPELKVRGDIAELTRSVAGAMTDVQVTGQLGSSSQG